MSEVPASGRAAASAFRRHPPGIVVELEYRVRLPADRRRRARRRSAPWAFHERRRGERRCGGERRYRVNAGLERLARDVLRRHAVHDGRARRLLRRLDAPPAAASVRGAPPRARTGKR